MSEETTTTVSTVWLNQLRSEFVTVAAQRDQLRAEVDTLRLEVALSLGEPMARLFCQLLEGCFSDGLLPDTAEANELLGWIARSYPQLTIEREFSHLPWADAAQFPR